MIEMLYDCFKHWSERGSVYVISDTHFDDEDCHLMDKNWIAAADAIERIKKVAHKCDTLICLGDVGDPKYFEQVKAHKVLIKGNHDAGNKNYEPYFDEIYEGALIIAEKVILSHEPLVIPGFVNIHGHNHAGPAITNSVEYIGINVASNVVKYEPVNLGAIIRGGLCNSVRSIHRCCIDKAAKNSIKKKGKK